MRNERRLPPRPHEEGALVVVAGAMVGRCAGWGGCENERLRRKPFVSPLSLRLNRLGIAGRVGRLATWFVGGWEKSGQLQRARPAFSGA